MRNVTKNQAAQPGTELVRRGRGRPRKPDAMSNAERQAAWRARHRAEKTVTVTKKITADHDALQQECERLRGELAQARRKLEAVSQAAPSVRAPSDVTSVLQRTPGPVDAEAGERRLTISGTRFFALDRLARHSGLSRREVIERMADWADDVVSRSFGDDDAAFNRYIDRRNENNQPAGKKRAGRRAA